MGQGSLIKDGNEAVDTTASVAYGWVGAVIQIKKLFSKNFNSVTNGWTDK